jgi:hypothetical protein
MEMDVYHEKFAVLCSEVNPIIALEADGALGGVG